MSIVYAASKKRDPEITSEQLHEDLCNDNNAEFYNDELNIEGLDDAEEKKSLNNDSSSEGSVITPPPTQSEINKAHQENIKTLGSEVKRLETEVQKIEKDIELHNKKAEKEGLPPSVKLSLKLRNKKEDLESLTKRLHQTLESNKPELQRFEVNATISGSPFGFFNSINGVNAQRSATFNQHGADLQPPRL